MGYEQELDQSEDRQKKRSRRRKAKPLGIIVLAAIVVAIVVCVVILVSVGKEAIGNIQEQREKDAASVQDETDRDDLLSQGEGDAEDVDPFDGKPYYYDDTREDRYMAFSVAHPEIAMDDIYWMVNCDLDNPPYTDTHEIPDPNSILLLINKHFYLPDGYAPTDLISVGNTMMREEAGQAMQAMISAAKEAGHNIWSQSGYRSYDLQVRLYSQYSANGGEEAADVHSARPGYSEHQTGLTTDLNTITDAFGDTPEGKWVAENCWQYGYIVRYTKENTDITLYKSEPWHMRYIGHEAAMIMHDEQIESFEEYWVKYVKYTPQ